MTKPRSLRTGGTGTAADRAGPADLSYGSQSRDFEPGETERARDAELERSRAQLRDTLEQLERMFGVLAELLQGQILGGRYRLETKLRTDEVGVLYAATDLEQHTAVDVRVARAPRIDPASIGSHGLGFVHPHAAEILDAGLCEVGLPYLVVEALSGETLEQRLSRRPRIETVVRLRWGLQVLDALQAAHDHGVVHGRVGPASVFLRSVPGQSAPAATLIDFGVDALTCGSPLGDKRAQLGPYWPVDGPCPADPACDVHGAAVLLCRLSSGLEPEPEAVFEPEAWMLRGVPEPLVQALAAALAAREVEPSDRPRIGDLASIVRNLLRVLEHQGEQ